MSIDEEKKNENAELRTTHKEGMPLMDWGNGIVGWEAETDPLNPVSEISISY
jgi:hypothetical protein